MAKRELDFFDNELPNCSYCIHAFRDDRGITDGSCKAFPDGIPLNILSNELLHDEIFEEQLGDYVFEEAD